MYLFHFEQTVLKETATLPVKKLPKKSSFQRFQTHALCNTGKVLLHRATYQSLKTG